MIYKTSPILYFKSMSTEPLLCPTKESAPFQFFLALSSEITQGVAELPIFSHLFSGLLV